jgi:protein TonB
MNGLVFWALASGFGAAVIHEITNTEVVIIEQPEIEEEEPPPPPPVDVELPPPPPQVILPDFVFDQPPPPNAIQQVQIAKDPPRPAEVRPPPPVTIVARPKPGRRFEKPEYPAASIRAQEEGEVVVSVCVDEQGRMSNVKIVKSSGFPRLDEATLKGLPRTRLDPAKGSDGKPIALCNPPYQFTLAWDLEEAR